MNVNRKLECIKDAAIDVYQNILDLVYSFEDKYGIDMCEFNNEQFIDMLSQSKTKMQMFRIKAFCDVYCEWSLDNGYVNNIVDVKNIDEDKIDYKLENLLYLTPEQYYNALKKFDEQINLNSSIHYFKALFMCVYEGIYGSYGDELLLLKLDMIKSDNTLQLSNGLTIKLSDELIKELKYANKISYFQVGPIERELNDWFDGAIFKHITRDKEDMHKYTEEQLLKKAQIKLSKYFSVTISRIIEEDVTCKIVYRSGLVNYVCSFGKPIGIGRPRVQKLINDFGSNKLAKNFICMDRAFIDTYFKEKLK